MHNFTALVSLLHNQPMHFQPNFVTGRFFSQLLLQLLYTTCLSQLPINPNTDKFFSICVGGVSTFILGISLFSIYQLYFLKSRSGLRSPRACTFKRGISKRGLKIRGKISPDQFDCISGIFQTKVSQCPPQLKISHLQLLHSTNCFTNHFYPISEKNMAIEDYNRLSPFQ